MTGPGMPGRQLILLAVMDAPARADTRAGADWRLILAGVAWAEGHGGCGGLRLGPDGQLAVCMCTRLAFEIGPPLPGSAVAA